ncbi:MAG: type II secretion system F family protein [Candidatus Marsarchaeota archaeon]|nr:type II secretion system F family protein [Candidatus Marsarchaeota archaeon]MCL5101783.1 type II secretion system F family protein [Candidatus Marsarchaeota archaeon]
MAKSIFSRINFERLVSRSMARFLSKTLDLAGSKMDVNKFLGIVIVGGFTILIVLAFALFLIMHINMIFSFAGGVVAALLFGVVMYMLLNYKIDQRKTFVESILPDYFSLAAANLKSGIALDRSMLLAARPEFKYFSSDVQAMNRNVFGGETFENALRDLAGKYKSNTFQHAVRMMIEAQKFGGAMADLMEQLSKDMRAQQMLQKEVSGQLLMYSLFIAFAGLIAAPVLYGLTSQMIVITDTVWKGILASNPGGLPTTGVSFLKPSPPKISPTTYHDFSLVAIAVITGFASLIMSTISSGSTTKGIRLLPLFIIVGLGIYFVVGSVIASLFSSFGSL